VIASSIHSFATDHDHDVAIPRHSLQTAKAHKRVVVATKNQGFRWFVVSQGLSELDHDLEVRRNSFVEGRGDARCFWRRAGGDGNRGCCGGCGAVLVHAG
jgi:hypothetical protein